MRELIELLQQAVKDRDRRAAHIKRFQELVWESEYLHADPDIVRVLSDLAHDLDFFEPDDRTRTEDPSLYGDARLEDEIRSALKTLQS